MLYVAKTLDMFEGIISLVARSIIATVADSTEIGKITSVRHQNFQTDVFDLGKIYSVMGVLENLSKFIFVPIYTNIYKYTVDTFPNAYFICSFVVITIVSILSW